MVILNSIYQSYGNPSLFMQVGIHPDGHINRSAKHISTCVLKNWRRGRYHIKIMTKFETYNRKDNFDMRFGFFQNCFLRIPNGKLFGEIVHNYADLKF